MHNEPEIEIDREPDDLHLAFSGSRPELERRGARQGSRHRTPPDSDPSIGPSGAPVAADARFAMVSLALERLPRALSARACAAGHHVLPSPVTETGVWRRGDSLHGP